MLLRLFIPKFYDFILSHQFSLFFQYNLMTIYIQYNRNRIFLMGCGIRAGVPPTPETSWIIAYMHIALYIRRFISFFSYVDIYMYEVHGGEWQLFRTH